MKLPFFVVRLPVPGAQKTISKKKLTCFLPRAASGFYSTFCRASNVLQDVPRTKRSGRDGESLNIVRRA